MMMRARKTAPKSETSFQRQHSQLASRPFTPRAEEHEAPERESRVSFSLADIDIFPREIVQSRQTHAIQRGQLQEAERVLQAKEEAGPNITGMPDRLKSGLEALSGMDLSGVRVHRNSPKPAKLNALAYTRGQEIHLAPGQETHLPHEGWHTVQQMQGRVRATKQAMGILINDNEGLEHEADVMGAKVSPCNAHRLLPQAKTIKFRTNGQRVSALTQMVEPQSKQEKRRLDQLRRRYLEINEDDRTYHEAIFNDFARQADTLDEIEKFVSDQERKMTQPLAAAPPISVGEPAAAKPISTSSPPSTIPMSTSSSASTTPMPAFFPQLLGPEKGGKQKKKEKKKKEKKYISFPLPDDASQTSAPKPNVWTEPPKQKGAAAASSKGKAPIAESIDEEDRDVPGNKFIKELIKGKQGFIVSKIEVDGGQTKETVYYRILVLGPIQPAGEGRKRPFRDRYTLYLHYHPNPEQGINWLHIKKVHGGTPENIVEVTNWLFANYLQVLRDGMEQWQKINKQEATKRF